MGATMRAARMHQVGEPMQLEDVPVPDPGPGDVRIAVHAVNIVPNLANILNMWTTWFPQNPLPSLPAIFGLDPAGVVEAVGDGVEGFRTGDRVYVNPGRHCGSCRSCRNDDSINCGSYAFSGYFGFSPTAVSLLDRYQGGLAEYMVAPAYALVKIPDVLPFNAAARFGYLGTMYSALRKAGATPGKSILINGISGTLGIGAALLAPALGLTRVYGTGRDRGLLEQVDKLAPGRFRLHSLDDGPVDEWIRDETDGYGVDIYIDALGPGAPHEVFLAGMRAMARGAIAVNIGAVAGDLPVDIHRMMDQQLRLIGSAWFTSGEGQAMADMVEAGLLDLSALEHQVYPLEQINDAISGIAHRNGGFSNFIINPLATADPERTPMRVSRPGRGRVRFSAIGGRSADSVQCKATSASASDVAEQVHPGLLPPGPVADAVLGGAADVPAQFSGVPRDAGREAVLDRAVLGGLAHIADRVEQPDQQSEQNGGQPDPQRAGQQHQRAERRQLRQRAGQVPQHPGGAGDVVQHPLGAPVRQLAAEGVPDPLRWIGSIGRHLSRLVFAGSAVAVHSAGPQHWPLL
jgi:threonine dehydrogenase-like Zn-dependent dehydrogenase